MTPVNPDPTDVATLRARATLRALATPAAPARQAFIAGRFPYTYAYDHVRTRLSGPMMSRDQASAWVSAQADAAGLPKEFVCQMLATAYCIEHNVEMPASLLTLCS